MTSSERKIINCLWETKEKTHIRLVAQKANLSSDYARLLCRSLARSGHIKFENDLAHLLKKGRSRFDASTSLSINPEPVERIENNDPVADKPIAVAANVTLLTDEPAVASPASDQSDVVRQSSPQEEENQEEGASEDKDKDKLASSDGIENPRQSRDSDEELDKALADLEPSSKKDAGEETKIADAEDAETELKSEPEKETEEKEPVAEIGIEAKAEAAEIERKKQTVPQEMEMKKETKPADNPVPVALSEISEKAATKDEPAKPSGSFGASFKKIVPIAKLSRILDKVGINWFAEKK